MKLIDKVMFRETILERTMRAFLTLPVFGLVCGFMIGMGVEISRDLIPVFGTIFLAYGTLALFEVAPEPRAHEPGRQAHRMQAGHH